MAQRPTRTNLSLRSWIIGPLIVATLLHACKKDETADPAPPDPVAPTPSVTLRIEPHIDGVDLRFDTMMYITPSNLTYSVSRSDYYISRIVLHGANSTPNDTLPGPFHVMDATATEFELGTLPAGEYTGAELILGLTPDLNVTGGLPNTMENINMAWPDAMGGGYHFIKFEGHFLNGASSVGFAMHIGNNNNLPRRARRNPSPSMVAPVPWPCVSI